MKVKGSGILGFGLRAAATACLLWTGLVASGEQFTISVGTLVSQDAPAPGAGYIEASTATDVYTFSGTAGQLVYVQEISVAAAFAGWLGWDLKAPSGATVFSSYFEGKDEGRRTLPETGTYTLRVRVLSNNAAYVGAYSFYLRAVPADPVFNITIGDTVTNGVPMAGAGNIEVPGANDVYQFSATAGDLIFLEELGLSSTFEDWLQWELTTPSGQRLFRSFFGGAHEGRKALTETGTYTLRFSLGANETSYVGTYGFRIRAVPPDHLFSIAIGQMVSNGVPGVGAGNIEVPGAQDHYTFQGTAGQNVFFENISVAQSLGGWLHWEVKTPTGKTLFTTFFGTTSVGRKTLPETGIYTIHFSVGVSSTTLLGTYAFRINPIDDEQFPIAIGDLVNDGVPGAGAGRIEDAGGKDTYTFTGIAGQKIIFEEISAAAAFAGWLKWEIKTPGSNNLATDFFHAGRKKEYTLPENGTYTLRVFVAHTNPQYVGAYSFRTYCEVYAGPDKFAVLPGGMLAMPKAKFLCNDLCQGMDALAIDLPSLISSAGGVLAITNATLFYHPPAGFSGVDTFVYRVRGLFGGESTAVATVSVMNGANSGATVVSCFRTAPTTMQVCLLWLPGQMYIVETSPDMASWVPAGNVVADDNGSINYFYSTTGADKLFYRFRRP